MSIAKFQEIETKYKADDIKLSDFRAHVLAMNPVSVLEAGSYDQYFEKSENLFIRYREGNRPELTMKEKSKDTNNWVRTELNLPLSTTTDSLRLGGIVAKFCDMLGFKHNFTIWKNYFVFFWGDYDIVYYIVYDDEMKEKGRFIEIEMDEHRSWASEEEAWKALGEVEKALGPLGITPANRTRRSLYERFRKNTNVAQEPV